MNEQTVQKLADAKQPLSHRLLRTLSNLDETGLSALRHVWPSIDPFDSQRSSEDISHKPTIIRPIGTKLKLQNNTGSHTDCEVDTEQLHPELRNAFPCRISGFVVNSLHDRHYDAQSQGEWHKYPVIHGGEGKLCPRPIDKRIINCLHNFQGVINKGGY